MYACMYVCMYICMYICVYVCMYTVQTKFPQMCAGMYRLEDIPFKQAHISKSSGHTHRAAVGQEERRKLPTI